MTMAESVTLSLSWRFVFYLDGFRTYLWQPEWLDASLKVEEKKLQDLESDSEEDSDFDEEEKSPSNKSDQQQNDDQNNSTNDHNNIDYNKIDYNNSIDYNNKGSK